MRIQGTDGGGDVRGRGEEDRGKGCLRMEDWKSTPLHFVHRRDDLAEGADSGERTGCLSRGGVLQARSTACQYCAVGGVGAARKTGRNSGIERSRGTR